MERENNARELKESISLKVEQIDTKTDLESMFNDIIAYGVGDIGDEME